MTKFGRFWLHFGLRKVFCVQNVFLVGNVFVQIGPGSQKHFESRNNFERKCFLNEQTFQLEKNIIISARAVKKVVPDGGMIRTTAPLSASQHIFDMLGCCSPKGESERKVVHNPPPFHVHQDWAGGGGLLASTAWRGSPMCEHIVGGLTICQRYEPLGTQYSPENTVF